MGLQIDVLTQTSMRLLCGMEKGGLITGEVVFAEGVATTI